MNGDNLRDSNQNEAQEPNTQQNSRKTIIWEYVLGLPLLPGIPGKRNTTHRSKSFTNHYWQISQCWHPRTCFFFFFFFPLVLAKGCHSSICICINNLGRAARACLFGGLGAAVSPAMPKHWGSFMKWWQMHAGHHHNDSSHYQMCPHSQDTETVWKISHFQGQMSNQFS